MSRAPLIGFVCSFRTHRPAHTKSQQTNRRIPGWFRAAIESLLFCGPAKGAQRRAAQPVPRVLRDCPASGGRKGGARVTIFSPDYLAAKSCIRQTVTSGSCSLPIDQYLPSPRPSGGSLVIIGPGTGCQGQWLFWGPDGVVEPALR